MALLEELVAALNDHDLDRAYALYRPDARHLGLPRAVTGLEEMRAVDAEFFEAFPDHHREVERCVADDHGVAIVATMSATHAASGRPVRFAFSNLILVRGGLIASMDQLYDSEAIIRQLRAA